MGARFILSLDCEGKWGVADRLGGPEHESLTDVRLREAYGKILQLLDEYRVPSTFAFVGLFGETPGAFHALRPAIDELAARAPGYLGPALADITEGTRQGWHGAWAVEAVAERQMGHEIALHGLTHVPWSGVDADFIRAELALLPELTSAVRASRTFIYPRNEISHVALLPDAGIEGYRLARPHRSRARSLLSEFDLSASPEADPPDRTAPLPIPAGYFVNWRHGPRTLVPVAVSIARARRMLNRAAAMGKVVHYWLHPENVASAPGTLAVLEGIVLEATRLRDAGRCEILTQLDYCRRIAGAEPRAAA